MVILLSASCSLAQTPAKAKHDTNDSGYVSPYLPIAKANRVQDSRGSEKELDNPKRARKPCAKAGAVILYSDCMLFGKRPAERARYGNMLPTAASAAAANPVTTSLAASSSRLASGHWVNIGPTKNDYIQNGVTLHVTDSGRMRTILVNPENPDIVYLLTSSGGLWKTENFSSPHPHWSPKTDSTFTTSGRSRRLRPHAANDLRGTR